MSKVTKGRLSSFYFIVNSTVLILAFLLVGCGGGGTSEPAPRPSPSATPTPTPTPSPSPTPTTPDVTITIDPAQTKLISPWIYGINFATQITDLPPYLTLDRMGGNRWTAYNWENNASNAGSDWNYQSDDYLLPGDNTPAEAVRPIIVADTAAEMGSLVTVQLQGYVSADKSGPVNPAQFPTYLPTRFNQVKPKKADYTAVPFTETPDQTDDYVFMDEFLWALNEKVPGIFGLNVETPTFISLDNEPDLWHATHREIQGPTAVTPDEYIDKTIAMTAALKDTFLHVQIFGAVHYGFNGIVCLQEGTGFSSDYWFTDKYLQEMKAASEDYGARLVDVYDFHWYSEVRVGGTRITELSSSTLTDAQVQAIVQSPRSLWDTTYRENSWIANDYFHGPIYLLPRLQEKIDTHWAGTKLAVTEYQNGGWNHIAGTIAQADNLGIFGTQGVFAANFWPPGDSGTYPYALAAFRAFRGFDGTDTHFGDISLHSTSSDVEKVVVYASSDSTTPGRVVMVAINRSTSPHLVQVNGLSLSGTAYRYQMTAQSAAAQLQSSTPVRPVLVGQEAVNGSSWEVALPPLSVSTIEVK